MMNTQLAIPFLLVLLMTFQVQSSRRKIKDPAKYSTGAPTDDNPIVYNVPGSDSEEKKEVEDPNENCVDHLKECEPNSSFTQRTEKLDDVWEIPKRSNCCKGLFCRVGSTSGTVGTCQRY